MSAKEMIPGLSGEGQVKCRLQGTGGLLSVGEKVLLLHGLKTYATSSTLQ